MKRSLLFFFLLFPISLFAQDTIRAMFYNLYRFPVNPPEHRENNLKVILQHYHPDLLMTCELVNEAGADDILNTSFQDPGYARAVFVPTQTDISDPLQQMVFYNTRKLIMLQQQIHPTHVREINHYTFLLNTESHLTDSTFLDVFVTHLKSSDGAVNKQLRLGMIDTFVEKLKEIPKNHHVLLAGDFNLYSAFSEPAYQKILDTTNDIKMIDPIDMPGDWSNNDTFKAIHTQATRISADGFGQGGATGGLDDRFDFIMISEELKTATDLHYTTGSYKAFGNNGNCFDNRIDAYECDGAYEWDLRKNLYYMSDHLPVVMELTTDRHFVGIKAIEPPSGLSFPLGNVVREGHLVLSRNTETYASDAWIHLYNNLGQCIKSISFTRNQKRMDIDMVDVTSGIYYLKYRGKGYSRIYKIQKL